MSGPAEGIHSLGILSLHQTPTGAAGFLEVLVQANIVRGKYWGKNILLAWRCAKYGFSQESTLPPRLAACLLKLVTFGGLLCY